MENDLSFGQVIRERRLALGLTQAELARRANCASVTVRKIEGDALRPSVQLAEFLANSLNIPKNEHSAFVRLARQEKPPSPIPTPTPTPAEIGREDLSGRAVKGFQLGEQIGSGGFGIVYRAFQPSIQRDVAVKIIMPRYANQSDFIRRFETEALLVAKLEHPHIVPLYDYWREPGAAYLIMRLLRGGNLEALLSQKGPLKLDVFQRVVFQVGQALAEAHRHHVVHRDIKPANLLLDENENAYLADFGIAKNMGPVGEKPLSDEHPFLFAPAYISPEQIRNEPISPASDIYCFGLLMFEMLTGQKAFNGPTPISFLHQQLHDPLPSLLDFQPGLSPELDAVIRRAGAKKPEERFPTMDVLLQTLDKALLRGISPPFIPKWTMPAALLAASDVRAIENPYRGLQAFTEAEADVFFGREMFVQDLLEFLSDGTDLERIAAVVGPSGSGKSSAVKAGLLPALRRGGLPGSENWFIVDFTPGGQPWEELAAALLRVTAVPPDDFLTRLQAGSDGLVKTVQGILPADDEIELLLVIDQFEELFTLVADEEVRTAFLDGLVSAVLTPQSRLRIVLTMRADFIDKPLQYVDFGEILRQRLALLLPMAPDELARAITRPVEQLGMSMTTELVSTITRDVAREPGMLPLLQFALTELFAQRDGPILTLDHYQRTNGVKGSLTQRAEKIYEYQDEVGRAVVRQLFLRLVTLGEGAGDSRRRVLLAELDAMTPHDEMSDRWQERQKNIIETYGQFRLLTFDQDPGTRNSTIEVAHEALLREWPRLREWLRENRAGIRRQRLLAAAAKQWAAAAKDPSYLLRGSRLVEFESWSETATIALTHSEQLYIQHSIEARDKRQAQEEARRRRELQTAQQLAEEQKQRAAEQLHSASRLRRRAYLLTGALVLVAIFAIAAFRFARSSANNADLAATREADALANFELAATREGETEVERLVAVAAQATAEVEAIVRANAEAEAAVQRDEALASERAAQEAFSLSLAANARQVLAADDTELALLLALAANNVAAPPLPSWQTLIDVAYAPAANSQITFSGTLPLSLGILPGAEKLLVGTENGELQLYDLENRVLRTTFAAHEGAIEAVAVSPDGKRAMSGDGDGTAILWDLETGQIVYRFTGHNGSISAIAFSPDGRRAVVGVTSYAAPAALTVWDLEKGQILSRFGDTLTGNRRGINGLALFANGTKALVGLDNRGGSNPFPILFWDLETQEIYQEIASPNESTINDVALSPDQRQALLAADDNNLYLMDQETGEVVLELNGHSAPVESVAFSPDGKTAVSGGRDDIIIWWEVITGRILYRFAGHQDDVRRVSFLNNKQIVSSAADGSVRIWDLHSNWEVARWQIGAAQEPIPITPLAMAFSPFDQSLLISANDNSLIRMDYETGATDYLLKNHSTYVTSIAISANGERAVVGLNDSSMMVWDLRSGNRLRTVTGHMAGVLGVDLSADGQFALSASLDGQVFYWNIQEGRILQRMTGSISGFGVDRVRFLPGDRTAVSSSRDGSMVIWDVETGTQIKRLTGLTGGAGTHLRPTHTWGIWDFAISPDGRQLLSSGWDQSLLLWDMESGESLRRFSGPTGYVYDVAFLPHEQAALTTTQNRTLIMWDMEEDIPIREYTVYDRRSLGFSAGFLTNVAAGEGPVLIVHPEGRTAVTAEFDGLIVKWRLTTPSPAELMAWITENRLLRELTCLERQTYQILPLCAHGVPVETTADLLESVAAATSTISIPPLVAEGWETPTPYQFAVPEIPLREAQMGENRGELQRHQYDVWVFNGEPGDILTIEMVADRPMHQFLPLLAPEERFASGALDAVLILSGLDGSRLFRANDSAAENGDILTDVRIDAFVVPPSGTFHIEARSYLDDHAGAYTLILEEADVFDLDPVLLQEYAGHYFEGPWEFDAFFYVEDGNFKADYLQTGETFDLIPVSENEFVLAGDGMRAAFTRDESGQVDGYDIWISLIHPVGGRWYRAIRLDN